MKLDKTLFDNLPAEAAANPRLRQSMDLRNSPEDLSQRMLNALMPDTDLPIHRHSTTSETVVILRGKIEEIFYEECSEAALDGDSRCTDVCRRRVLYETDRILLESNGDVLGLCVPVGQWHTINVIEPTIILECNDGKYEPQISGTNLEKLKLVKAVEDIPSRRHLTYYIDGYPPIPDNRIHPI